MQEPTKQQRIEALGGIQAGWVEQDKGAALDFIDRHEAQARLVAKAGKLGLNKVAPWLLGRMLVHDHAQVAADDDQVDARMRPAAVLELRERRAVRLLDLEGHGRRLARLDRLRRREVDQAERVRRRGHRGRARRPSAAGDHGGEDEKRQHGQNASAHGVPFGKRYDVCGGT